MNHLAKLALARQAFDQLVPLCEPENVSGWNPSPEQRAQYVHLVNTIVEGYGSLVSMERRHLREEGQIHSVLPESHLGFVRETLKPRLQAIRAAADLLDPEGKLLRDFFHDMDVGTHPAASHVVRGTFDEGLHQIYELLDRNPDWGDDHSFVPDLAGEVMDSRLIQFDPDAWLNRASELAPIRSDKRNFSLPMHVRMRLEELYRAYVFGLWLSVLGLSRAILEYAILDNASKFGIDPIWPVDQYGKRKEKKLSHLIDELNRHLPDHMTAMNLLRELGNEYLHPNKSATSKDSMLRRQHDAEQVVRTLVEVVEAIYLAPRKG